MPKLAWGKVLPQKSSFDGQGSKENNYNYEKKFLNVSEDIDLFF